MFGYAVTVFLGAFLLFQVEPMAGKVLLPQYGGTPAVWLTCLLFFQTMVLVGYSYSHSLQALSSRRWQGILHAGLLLLALCFLPILGRLGKGDAWPEGPPSIGILASLLRTLGLPCLVLTATAPLFQCWFSRTRTASSAYRLYSISNIGSLLGLALYPTLTERFLPVGVQSTVWSGLFCLFTALCVWKGLLEGDAASEGPLSAAVDETLPPDAESGGEGQGEAGGRVLVWWGFLSFLGSTLMMATTHQLCQYVASVPFLWILPLGVYLITFIVSFDRERWYRREVFTGLMALAGPVGCAMLAVGVFVSLPVQALSYCFVLFVGCMVCHGELARSKPRVSELTLFYLLVAVGGILGGLFVAVLAPVLFAGYWEFHLALGGCCLLPLWARFRSPRPNRQPGPRWPSWILGGAVWVTWIFLTLDFLSSHKGVVDGARNFYGLVRVVEGTDSRGAFRRMEHGRINHGLQYTDPEISHSATTYFGPESGIGQAFRFHPKRLSDRGEDRNLRVAIVGLGAGTLATYGREGDFFRFFEINPEVVRMAKEDFTFLRDTAARVETHVGDGRIGLREEAKKDLGYDLIVLDAFSGDATPIHLLTREAFELYQRRLVPGGLLAVNLTNRFADLSSVVRGLASELEMEPIRVRSERDERLGTQPATWAILAQDARFGENPAIRSAQTAWTPQDPAPLVWTDDFSSLWQVLRF